MPTRRKASEREPRALRESVEEVWLAGLGALAVAEEEGNRVFNNLLKRGEKLENRLVKRGTEVEKAIEKSIEQRRDAVQKAGRQRMNAMTTQVESFTNDTVARMNRGVDETMTRVLHRIGVPTAKEIADLTKRVEALRATLAKNAMPVKANGKAKKPAARKRHAATRRATARNLPVPMADTPRPIGPVGADV